MISDSPMRSFRVAAVATLCLIGLTASVWADPIVVTSGLFGFGRGPANEASFTVTGDGFFLDAFAVPMNFAPLCFSGGCRPGDTLNMSLVAGVGSGVTQVRLPPAFTLGTAVRVIVNGTEIVAPGPLTFPGPVGLTGSLRFNVMPVVLPSEAEAVTNLAANAPFVFNGHATGFAIQDVATRVPLFDVNLAGQGTAHVEFESGLVDGIFREPVFRFFFTAAPATTPEPATLALFATGLLGLAARARRQQRHR